jgi:hypothetical protein
MRGYIAERELARILEIEPELLREIAVHARLPFSWTTRSGLMVRPTDLEQWRAASAVRAAAR